MMRDMYKNVEIKTCQQKKSLPKLFYKVFVLGFYPPLSKNTQM